MHDRELKPLWTSATFLVYTGGLTVLLGGLAALGYLSASYGSGATAAWALLVLVILYAIAHALRVRGRLIAAGIFAFASVIAWGAFLVFLFDWFGWHGFHSSIHHWSWSRLALWLLILAAAFDDRRRFGLLRDGSRGGGRELRARDGEGHGRRGGGRGVTTRALDDETDAGRDEGAHRGDRNGPVAIETALGARIAHRVACEPRTGARIDARTRAGLGAQRRLGGRLSIEGGDRVLRHGAVGITAVAP